MRNGMIGSATVQLAPTIAYTYKHVFAKIKAVAPEFPDVRFLAFFAKSLLIPLIKEAKKQTLPACFQAQS